jgi:hypothetical protein
MFLFSCCVAPGNIDVVEMKIAAPPLQVDHRAKRIDALAMLTAVEERHAWHFEGVMEELKTSPCLGSGRKQLHARRHSAPELYSTRVRSECYSAGSIEETAEFEVHSSPTGVSDQSVFAPAHRQKSQSIPNSSPVPAKRKSLVFKPTVTSDMDWT